MDKFRTTLPLFAPDIKVDHTTEILSIGSCFAVNMANRLSQIKMKCESNPFGILFNPINIASCIEMCFADYTFGGKDLIERDGYWFSFWHHSEINHQDPEKLCDTIQNIQTQLKQKIQNSSLIIFTFGTAFYYRHIDSGIEVANCHKLPAAFFEKKRVTAEDVVDRFTSLIKTISKVNPKAQFIFTVSPVRHTKDGIIENNRSKAILHLSIEKIVQASSNAYYFPAYEIMMDDLRDYRFYKDDLLHPSNMAIDYIWKQFSEHIFSADCKQLHTKIQAIQNALAHKAFQPKSEQHQTFLKKTLEKIDAMSHAHPHIDFSTEKKKLLAILE